MKKKRYCICCGKQYMKAAHSKYCISCGLYVLELQRQNSSVKFQLKGMKLRFQVYRLLHNTKNKRK